MIDTPRGRKQAFREFLETKIGRDVQEALEEGFKARKSLREIAYELGVSHTLVANWASDLGYRQGWIRADGTAVV